MEGPVVAKSEMMGSLPLRTGALAFFVAGLMIKAAGQLGPAVVAAGCVGAVVSWLLAVSIVRGEHPVDGKAALALVIGAVAFALLGFQLGRVGCQNGCGSFAHRPNTNGLAANATVRKIRERSERALSQSLPGDAGPLLSGMTLGDASALSRSAKNDFRRSSLTHIVAASGQNVSLLIVFVGLLCGVVGLNRRQRLAVSGAAIIAYIPLAGGEAPIRRAAVMGLCALLSGAGARRRAVVHSLLLAAAVTVLLDPNSLQSLSWQLSFAAVVGMMLLGEPISDRLIALGLNGLVAEALGATVAATIFTAPLIAAAVGRYSLTAIPANILVAGVVGPVMFLGFAAALVGQLSLHLATPLVAAAALPVAYILEVAKLFASPTWAVRQWRPDLVSVAVATGVPTLLILSLRPRRGAT